MRDELYYKSLRADGAGPYSAVHWPLDGSWIEAAGKLDPCRNGIHVCRRNDLIRWMDARIFVVEIDGEQIEGDDKVVCRRARVVSEFDTWNKVTQRLFAADCAESVLHLFEDQYPDDNRPRLAIEAVRKFARGEIGLAELTAARDAAQAAALEAAQAAARDAAWDSAWAAAEAAAWAAADSAQTAAQTAARTAARADARAAAEAAADDATRAAQPELLFDYLDGRRA